MSALLERDREVAELEDLLARAGAGTGGLVLVEGEPGIGKTTLLLRAIELARARGVEVLRARGGQLEAALTFGLARQLLERRAQGDGRAAVLAGAARHAGPLLDGDAPAELDEPSLAHALYWATANLAERGPLLLTVDDAQWADPASLRWLVYLARRLDELPAAVVVSVSTGEPGAPADLLAALAQVHGAQRLELGPLSPAATETLVREELGDPDPALLRALHEAGGGNPLLVREAAATLAREPGAEPALRPAAVGRSVLRRLDRLPAPAAALARAVAVLGPVASLAHASQLAEIDPDAAARAADELAEARILDRGRPLAFTHPLVRSTLYAELGAGERSRTHARAARLLHAAGAGGPRVVAHLLEAEPAADAESVRLLRAAAAVEPDARRAAGALRRALDEPPPPTERAALLLELGTAETRAYEPDAVAHLTEARALATDAAQRLQATRALARAWTLAPQPADAVAWARDERAALGEEPAGEAREVALALRALEVIRGGVEPADAQPLAERAGAAATGAERYLLAALAYKATDHGTADDARALAERALAGGLRAEGIRGTGAVLVLGALELADALDRADAVALDALALAREHGDVSGSALALTLHADVAARRGALADAEAEARDALALADAHGLAWAQPVAIGTLIEALGEQGRGDEADAVLAERELSAWQQGSPRAASYLHARARLRLAQGRGEEALDDFRRAGEVMQRYAVDHPAMLGWRSGAAEALLALGRPDEAGSLAREELALARPFGAAQPIGSALRAAGLAAGGAEGLALLQEAAAVLAASPARLARARALVDLGAALRRSGERAAGREPLRLGLDLAHACGASGLADRAQQELEATGARPRRRAVSGLEALTPSERRVAEMAAGGLSNRDIAQALFLSVRTIENQLRQVYLKLDIASRKEIAARLGAS